MGTQFEYNLSLVAKRSWGGKEEGVRIQLYAGAGVVPTLDTALTGDDGSTRTLRQLARECGHGGYIERMQRKCPIGTHVFEHGFCAVCHVKGQDVELMSFDDAMLKYNDNERARRKAERDTPQQDAHVKAHERHERHEADMNRRFKGDTR